MVLHAALLTVGLLAAQAAPDRVSELIEQLGDPDLDVREAAQEALVALGDEAVPLLTTARDRSENPEVKTRAAEALKGIALQQKLSKVYRDSRRLRAAFEDVPLQKALEELGRQAAIRIEGFGAVPSSTLSATFEDVGLLEALDRLCAEQPELTFDVRSDSLALRRDRHPRWPAVYVGPFRVRVRELSVRRRSDFDAVSVTASASIVVDHEPAVKPLPTYRIALTHAADSQGATLETGTDDDAAFLNRRAARLRLGADENQNDRTFQLKNVTANATGLSVLRGSATFTFPIGPSEVKIPSPAVGSAYDSGDGRFEVTSVTPATLDLELSPAAGNESWTQDNLARRIDMTSFVFTDETGKDIKAIATFIGGVVVARAGAAVPQRKTRIRLHTQGARIQNTQMLRFSFIEKILERTVSFEFRDLKFP